MWSGARRRVGLVGSIQTRLLLAQSPRNKLLSSTSRLGLLQYQAPGSFQGKLRHPLCPKHCGAQAHLTAQHGSSRPVLSLLRWLAAAMARVHIRIVWRLSRTVEWWVMLRVLRPAGKVVALAADGDHVFRVRG